MKFIQPYFLPPKYKEFSFVTEAHSIATSRSFSQDEKSVSVSTIPVIILGYRC